MENFFGGKPSGKYTNYDTLSDKIQVDEIPLLASPKACLKWDITYKIYDCLYEHGALTPAEIDSLIKHRDIDMIAHTLERMGDIGITKPLNHENLTRANALGNQSIFPILYKVKKWELTEYIKE